jgi:hypothetical protein
MKTAMKIFFNSITVQRLKSETDWTLSSFFFDSVQRGVGVEDEKRSVKVKGETCIAAGTYVLALRYSPKFSESYYRDDEGFLIAKKDRTTPELESRYHTAHEMIWVKDVPNFEYILWHWGNSDDDTDGCYIVGSSFATIGTQKGVGASRKKYIEIYREIWQTMNALKAEGKFLSVTYKDAA